MLDYYKRHLSPWDVLCLGTICPLGRFVSWDNLSLGTFCLLDVLSPGRFVTWDVLSWDFLPWDVLCIALSTYSMNLNFKELNNTVTSTHTHWDGGIFSKFLVSRAGQSNTLFNGVVIFLKMFLLIF